MTGCATRSAAALRSLRSSTWTLRCVRREPRRGARRARLTLTWAPTRAPQLDGADGAPAHKHARSSERDEDAAASNKFSGDEVLRRVATTAQGGALRPAAVASFTPAAFYGAASAVVSAVRGGVSAWKVRRPRCGAGGVTSLTLRVGSPHRREPAPRKRRWRLPRSTTWPEAPDWCRCRSTTTTTTSSWPRDAPPPQRTKWRRACWVRRALRRVRSRSWWRAAARG